MEQSNTDVKMAVLAAGLQEAEARLAVAQKAEARCDWFRKGSAYTSQLFHLQYYKLII